MNLIAIFALTIVLLGLRYAKLPTLVWLVIWPIAVYGYLNWGITVPVPASVQNIYVCLTILGLIAYVLADTERAETVGGQLQRFITEKQYNTYLYALVVILPLGVATKIYLDMQVDVLAPTFGRTIHPAPPGEIDFKGKKIDLITQKNPYRELQESDPEAYKAHVANGKVVYYQNCVYCHGDDMRGDGIFAHGFNPVPANFNSATTIAMLQESYLFWRIAKGAPGLPDESGPWDSSMPAWEKFLSEEQIWDVILYLYEHTGYKPRAEEEHH